MWIEEIVIEQFGRFKQLPIENLGPGLTVIIGQNEAGKTTLLEFIRSIFFGYKKKSGKTTTNTYETPDGAPRSGWLTLRSGRNGRLRIERAERPGRKEGVLKIADQHGTLLDQSSVPLLDSQMGRAEYETLFAFDLEKMRELDRESLRSKTMGAALGSLKTNPLEVLGHIDQEAKRLSRRSRRDDRSLFAIHERLAEVHRQLKILREKPAHYVHVKEKLDRAHQTREQLAREIEETASTFAGIDKINSHQEEWQKLVALDAEIRSLEDAREFPADGVSRFDQALERRREAWESQEEGIAKLSDLWLDLEKLDPDPLILEHSDSISSLARQAQSLSGHPAQIAEFTNQVAQVRRNLDEQIAELGVGWTGDRVAASDPSMLVERSVQEFMEGWKESLRKIEDLRQRRESAQEACERLSEKIARKEELLAEVRAECRNFLSVQHRHLLGEWKEHEIAIRHIKQRIADKQVYTRRIESQRREREEDRKRIEATMGRKPSWLATTILALILASGGGGMIYAWATFPQAHFRFLWPVGLGALIAAPVLIGWHILRKRRHESRERERVEIRAGLRNIDEELISINTEQSKLKTLIDRETSGMRHIAEAVLGNPEASRDDVLEAERRSMSSEDAVRRRQALEDAAKSEQAELEGEERRGNEIERRLAQAWREFDELKTGWESYLEKQGLDPGLDPESAREIVRRLRTLKDELRRISVQEERLAEFSNEWGEFVTSVESLSQILEGTGESLGSPLDRVERWVTAQRQAKEALAERKALTERINDFNHRVDIDRQKIEQADESIGALLEAARVYEEESFREKGRKHARYWTLERERTVLIDSLLSGLRSPDEDSMRDLMAAQDWDANIERAASLRIKLERLRAESDELTRQCGRLDKEIETLEAEEETDRLLAEREELRARFNDTVREWTILKLASALLAKTLRVYESEKQPKLMEKTSEIFKAITDGSFRRVHLPMGSDTIKVERSDRTGIEETFLSRGTLEQVYLSLRLAHLDVYHRDEVNIPLVMDDILVNFDPRRAARTAEVLVKFAEDTGIQILFFTCHPETATLFPPTIPRVQLSEDPDTDDLDL